MWHRIFVTSLGYGLGIQNKTRHISEYKHVLANISRSRCCHTNATRATIAKLPNSSQL